MNSPPVVFLTIVFASFATCGAEQVVFSEINYNPGNGKPEFLEVTNNTVTPFEIAHWRVTSGVAYRFPGFEPTQPQASILQAFETILLTEVTPSAFRVAYPNTPLNVRIFGPWTGNLSNGGERLTLEDKNGVARASVRYGDGSPKWPIAADGGGHTLTLRNANRVIDDYRNWTASAKRHGSPGIPREDSPARKLVISEVTFDAEGSIDWIELRNLDPSTPFQLNGLGLGTEPDLSDREPLAGTIPPAGLLSIDTDFSAEEITTLFLLNSADDVLEAVRLQLPASASSYQAWPTGSDEFYLSDNPTRDAINDPDRPDGIVINEILYDAPSDHRSAEFIELYNRGPQTADLGGWRFSEGVQFQFPAETRLESGQYLVVASDLSRFQAIYPGVAVAGAFEGQLADSGELLRLEDAKGNLADEVHYLPGGDWPELADGEGSSMELQHPDMDNSQASAWQDSDDESAKASSKHFSITGEYARTAAITNDHELHFHLVGDAHAIVENVSVTVGGNPNNLVQNGHQESPSADSSLGWVSQGTHWASHLKPDRSLHLISDGHGDSKLNRTEIDLSNLSFGDEVTIEFDARWVHGKPRLIAQTNNRSVGQAVLLPVPENLGTPGARNSRALERAAPVVSALLHRPAVPRANEPVTVSATVTCADALAAVELVYRLDNSNASEAWRRVTMSPSSDQRYSAVIPNYRSDGNLIQFYVEATTQTGGKTQLPKNGPERPAMYVVDSTDKRSDLLTQRFIISEYHRSAIAGAGGGSKFASKFPLMSNHYFNATFIANEEEIYYNAELRNSGSVFTRTGDLSHAKWKLPGDRLFRGRRKSVIDPSTSYNDRLARFLLYRLGHPINENEWVKVIINNGLTNLREDMEPVATDFISRNFERGNRGTLLRIDDELSFPDGGRGGRLRDADWVYKGSDNPIRYHTEWLMRSQETRYDYSSFIQWLKTLEGDHLELNVLDRQLDRDLVCMNAAVRGYVADVDSFTMSRGKNGYFYQKPDGRWMLLQWDGDRTFGNPGAGFLGGIAKVNTYFRVPAVRRSLNYWLNELLTQHTNQSLATRAWLMAEENSTPSHRVQESTYLNWFSDREAAAKTFMGDAVNAEFAVTKVHHTTPGLVTLSGSAGPDIATIEIVGSPGVDVRWTDVSEWICHEVPLPQGTNTLTVRGLSHDGELRATTTVTVNNPEEAPPIAILTTVPASGRIGVGEQVLIEAGSSFDPDGTALTSSWSPPAGAGSFGTEEGGSTAKAVFTTPGLYTVSATLRDASGETTTADVEITVYGENGFNSFTADRLATLWTPENVDLPANSPDSAWYSLQEQPGQLVIQVLDDRAHPLGVPLPPLPAPAEIFSFDHPWKYDDSNTDLGNAGWTAMEFDDSTWGSGPGLLGFELSDLGEPLRTPLRRDRAAGLLTYYLRTNFVFEGDPIGAKLHLDHFADDGVVYYLNGREIGRTGFSVNEITHSTPADRPAAPNASLEVNAVVADGTGLRQGTNVLAAELHNESAGSSDAVLGTRLRIASYDKLDLARDFLEQPWITRALPPSGDWTLDTKVKLATLQFGEFLAGLQIEGTHDGKALRYSIGYEDGKRISVFRSDGNGTVRMGFSEFADSSTVELRIARRSDELIFAWIGGDLEAWQEILRIATSDTPFSRGGPMVATEEALNLRVAFDYVSLVETAPGRSPLANKLMLTEVMYHPAGNPEPEFLEFHNPTSDAISLHGVTIRDGNPFREFIFDDVTLEPGAYAVLANDRALFESRYGVIDNLIGTWTSGNLGNGGEQITIVDADDRIIHSFEYNDRFPWPEAADGDGPSLVLVAPSSRPEHADPANWRAGTKGGTPGRGESAFADWMDAQGFSDPLADPDRDGLNHLLTFALGADLQPVRGNAGPRVLLRDGTIVLTFTVRNDSGTDITVETSTDLQLWLEDDAETVSLIDNGDGTSRVVMRPTNAEALYLRLSVRLAQP